MAQTVYNAHVKSAENGLATTFKLDYPGIPTILTTTMIEQTCNKPIPVEAIRTLVEDPMQESDNMYVFMYPEDVDKKADRSTVYATKDGVQ